MTMPTDCREQLAFYAAAHPRIEVCGFVLSNWTYAPVMNRADRAIREFIFDPVGQMEVVRYAGMKDLSILGVFHSHPGGTKEPSQQDLKGWPILASGDHCRYWIISNGEVDEWRMVDGQPVVIE